MLTLRQVTLSRGNKMLLEKVNLTLFEKQKVGLIGHNGCGKSTLFDFFLGKLIADSGEFLINSKLRINHLSQHIPDSNQMAIDFVLEGDAFYNNIILRLAQAEQNDHHEEVLACHEELSQSGGYSKPAQAAAILSGLGFSTCEQKQKVNSFSGGWRMRLNLARCLIAPADLLLLDEPTNHLDMEAIFWLERFLKQSTATIILISHDRDFLDAFVTNILHVEDHNLNLYGGNYSTFEKTHAQQLALQQSMYEKQQAKINHMMSFVNRFKAKATKAKQAQGRLKAIEKMELVAAAQANSPFSFEFYNCPKAGNPLIQCSDLSCGYPQQNATLTHINFSLSPGDRIALLGPNGQGKSTFIKTLVGVLPVIKGELFQSSHLHIGYYAQHQLEQLDCTLSPIQTIQKLDPHAREQTIRDFLGGFNFFGDMAKQCIEHFSGGEKARLALAKLVWLKPNVLLLDEPTNHLDLGMRSAIEIALQSFEGALILISHDRHLLKTTVDDFYLVNQNRIQMFQGDLDDYHQWLQNRDTLLENTSPPASNLDYKQKKIAQNRVKKLEELMHTHQSELATLDQQLADPNLYENSENKSQLNDLLTKHKQLQDSLLKEEQEWFQLCDYLEQFS